MPPKSSKPRYFNLCQGFSYLVRVPYHPVWIIHMSLIGKSFLKKKKGKPHDLEWEAVSLFNFVDLSFFRAIENPTYSALTRPLCELSSLIPPQVLAPSKKLRVCLTTSHMSNFVWILEFLLGIHKLIPFPLIPFFFNVWEIQLQEGPMEPSSVSTGKYISNNCILPIGLWYRA